MQKGKSWHSVTIKLLDSLLMVAQEERRRKKKELQGSGGNEFSLGWFPTGTNCHQGDQEEYSTGGQDDV